VNETNQSSCAQSLEVRVSIDASLSGRIIKELLAS
jgi:hypothetical protein